MGQYNRILGICPLCHYSPHHIYSPCTHSGPCPATGTPTRRETHAPGVIQLVSWMQVTRKAFGVIPKWWFISRKLKSLQDTFISFNLPFLWVFCPTGSSKTTPGAGRQGLRINTIISEPHGCIGIMSSGKAIKTSACKLITRPFRRSSLHPSPLPELWDLVCFGGQNTPPAGAQAGQYWKVVIENIHMMVDSSVHRVHLISVLRFYTVHIGSL